MPTWRQQIRDAIIDFCNPRKSRGFTLQEFTDDRLGVLQAFRPSNNIAPDTLRRVLQELRDQGLFTFVNHRGLQTLRCLAPLEHEMEAIAAINLWDLRATPNLAGMFEKAAHPALGSAAFRVH